MSYRLREATVRFNSAAVSPGGAVLLTENILTVMLPPRCDGPHGMNLLLDVVQLEGK